MISAQQVNISQIASISSKYYSGMSVMDLLLEFIEFWTSKGLEKPFF